MISSWYYTDYASIKDEKAIHIYKKTIKRYHINNNSSYESLLRSTYKHPQESTDTSLDNTTFININVIYIPIYNKDNVVDCIKFILKNGIELSHITLIYLHAKACSIVYKNESLNIKGTWYNGEFTDLVYGPNMIMNVYNAFVTCKIDLNRSVH